MFFQIGRTHANPRSNSDELQWILGFAANDCRCSWPKMTSKHTCTHTWARKRTKDLASTFVLAVFPCLAAFLISTMSFFSSLLRLATSLSISAQGVKQEKASKKRKLKGGLQQPKTYLTYAGHSQFLSAWWNVKKTRCWGVHCMKKLQASLTHANMPASPASSQNSDRKALCICMFFTQVHTPLPLFLNSLWLSRTCSSSTHGVEVWSVRLFFVLPRRTLAPQYYGTAHTFDILLPQSQLLKHCLCSHPGAPRFPSSVANT